MPAEIEAYDYPYINITAVSKKQFDVHQELYKGYVKKVNEVWNKLAGDAEREEANATYSYYRGLKLGETYALDGVILHEMYFSNLGGRSKEPYGKALEVIKQNFGSYEDWAKDFVACGKAARGWAVLAYDQRSRSLHNFMSDAHDVGAIWTAYPILILDVYEHAYFIDYANKKADYIDHFMMNINWDIVNKRASVL